MAALKDNLNLLYCEGGTLLRFSKYMKTVDWFCDLNERAFILNEGKRFIRLIKRGWCFTAWNVKQVVMNCFFKWARPYFLSGILAVKQALIILHSGWFNEIGYGTVWKWCLSTWMLVFQFDMGMRWYYYEAVSWLHFMMVLFNRYCS